MSEEEPQQKPEGKQEPVPVRMKDWASRHKVAAWGIGAGFVALFAGAFVLWLWLRTFVSTDDAQVDGYFSSISPRVSGIVTGVHVEDNQYVHAGDVLCDIDRTDFDVAVAQAEANLAQAQALAAAQVPSVPITTVSNKTSLSTLASGVASASADVLASQRDVDSARARLVQSEAQDRLAQVDYARSSRLVSMGAVSKADLDEHTASADSAEADLRASRAILEATEKRLIERKETLEEAKDHLEEAKNNTPKQLEIQRATVESRQAAAKAAQAALDQARLNAGYTRIVAPVTGIVGRRSVNVGNHVEPGQQLLVVVQVDSLWITANFKETQLERMRTTQHARVSVDAYGTKLDGTVESLGGASGSRFSLFPPENATGNYVKVVQRLPVRINIAKNQRDYDLLRPGMSVEAKVFVR
jgi:membrane fusion protein, multidrug efflux system